MERNIKELNPMCVKCGLLGVKCPGEKNLVWTGCVWREVKK